MARLGESRAADAFGNALGNSIVRAGQPTPGTVDTEKSEKSVQAGQTAYNKAKAAGQSDAQAQRAGVTATVEAAGGAVDLTGEGLIAEQNFNPDDGFRISNGTDSAFINYGDASNLDYTLSAVGNFLSAAPAADLAFNFATGQIFGKHNRDATFAAAANRGAAALRAGVRNANTGLDANALIRQQTVGYTEFRQAQRSQFNDFYNGLSFNQRQAFDGGVNLFSAVIDYGQAIGDSAKYLLDTSGLHGTAPQARNINLIKDDLRTAGNVIGQVPSLFGDGGVVRFSVERNFFNKKLGGKFIYGEDLVGFQGKSPQAGQTVTNAIAEQFNVNLAGFTKDNLNASIRTALNFNSNQIETNLILESDFQKRDVLKFGKVSAGTRTVIDVDGSVSTSKAVNIGLKTPRLFDFNVEFRGPATTEQDLTGLLLKRGAVR